MNEFEEHSRFTRSDLFMTSSSGRERLAIEHACSSVFPQTLVQTDGFQALKKEAVDEAVRASREWYERKLEMKRSAAEEAGDAADFQKGVAGPHLLQNNFFIRKKVIADIGESLAGMSFSLPTQFLRYYICACFFS
jgi:hypothetical protein